MVIKSLIFAKTIVLWGNLCHKSSFFVVHPNTELKIKQKKAPYFKELIFISSFSVYNLYQDAIQDQL